ncbi:MAG: HAMP domain-containing histidine kinase [Gammaproteobacteria bacterium]|nr:HAMP domain-containing histidine kinase [Gammaproteobacteria bacterium]
MSGKYPVNEVYQHTPGRLSTLQNADWASLLLLNNYRLFVLVALTAVFYLADGALNLGQRNVDLFRYTHLAYVMLALIFSTLIRLRKPSLETQFYLQAYLDIVLLATLVYASGGVKSGLAILLVMHIAIIGHCAKGRYALLFAATTTCVLLSQELYARLVFGSPSIDLSQTALLCSSLFVVAFLTSVVLPNRISNHPADMQQLSMKRIAELNQQIIQELESGVLYIDTRDNVQMINETGLSMLCLDEMEIPIQLKQACKPLSDALTQWRSIPTAGNRPLLTQMRNRELLPSFTMLSNGGTLIKLEDHSLIRQQLQQLKLASLGRMSASIAHEIRNPLGAISNAVQLLEESKSLTPTDSRLLEIAHKHTQRIDRIVNDVLNLSNAQNTNIQDLDLEKQLTEFKDRFTNQNGLPENTLLLEIESPSTILFDSLHLDQILWNLCANAIAHNDDHIQITIRSHSDGQGMLALDISDNGCGIPESEQANVFEPFYTTSHSGSGLGLFLIRGLCELNNASVYLMPTSIGASFRITIPLQRQMAA